MPTGIQRFEPSTRIGLTNVSSGGVSNIGGDLSRIGSRLLSFADAQITEENQEQARIDQDRAETIGRTLAFSRDPLTGSFDNRPTVNGTLANQQMIASFDQYRFLVNSRRAKDSISALARENADDANTFEMASDAYVNEFASSIPEQQLSLVMAEVRAHQSQLFNGIATRQMERQAADVLATSVTEIEKLTEEAHDLLLEYQGQDDRQAEEAATMRIGQIEDMYDRLVGPNYSQASADAAKSKARYVILEGKFLGVMRSIYNGDMSDADAMIAAEEYIQQLSDGDIEGLDSDQQRALANSLASDVSIRERVINGKATKAKAASDIAAQMTIAQISSRVKDYVEGRSDQPVSDIEMLELVQRGIIKGETMATWRNAQLTADNEKSAAIIQTVKDYRLATDNIIQALGGRKMPLTADNTRAYELFVSIARGDPKVAALQRLEEGMADLPEAEQEAMIGFNRQFQFIAGDPDTVDHWGGLIQQTGYVDKTALGYLDLVKTTRDSGQADYAVSLFSVISGDAALQAQLDPETLRMLQALELSAGSESIDVTLARLQDNAGKATGAGEASARTIGEAAIEFKENTLTAVRRVMAAGGAGYGFIESFADKAIGALIHPFYDGAPDIELPATYYAEFEELYSRLVTDYRNSGVKFDEDLLRDEVVERLANRWQPSRLNKEGEARMVQNSLMAMHGAGYDDEYEVMHTMAAPIAEAMFQSGIMDLADEDIRDLDDIHDMIDNNQIIPVFSGHHNMAGQPTYQMWMARDQDGDGVLGNYEPLFGEGLRRMEFAPPPFEQSEQGLEQRARTVALHQELTKQLAAIESEEGRPATTLEKALTEGTIRVAQFGGRTVKSAGEFLAEKERDYFGNPSRMNQAATPLGIPEGEPGNPKQEARTPMQPATQAVFTLIKTDEGDTLGKQDSGSGKIAGALGLDPDRKAEIENKAGKQLTDERAAAMAIEEDFDTLKAKLPNYAGAPVGIQVALLDLVYNAGTGIINKAPKLRAAMAKNPPDYQEVLIQTLDTATINGKASKGIAGRRARYYNIGINDPELEIRTVRMFLNGTISYLTADGSNVFSFKAKGGKHEESAAGILEIK